jgi:hypothetical protein
MCAISSTPHGPNALLHSVTNMLHTNKWAECSHGLSRSLKQGAMQESGREALRESWGEEAEV